MEYALLVALGFGIGTLGTLIGAGGGFLLMPILLLWHPERSPAMLTAVSLAIVFANATSGSLSYARMKRIDYRSGLLFLSVGIPGAVLGARVVDYVPRLYFNLIFGLLLLAAGLFIILRPVRETSQRAALGDCFRRTVVEADGTRHQYGYSLPLGMTLSFLVGFASSLLGIGGGIIHVPAMVHLLSFPVHLATATSHFILAAMALSGTIVHLLDGTLSGQLPTVAALAAGAIAGAQLGARLSNRVHSRWIMRILGVALGLVGARILVSVFLP
jgi:uncharacterized membrane protein YfcA